MDKYSDLAPWILGGLSTAAVALAMTSITNNRTARTLPTPQPATAEMLPAAAPAAAAWRPLVIQAVIQPVGQAVAPATQMVSAPARGQVWECTTNGQRTFSNNPCGEKSFLREFGSINTMDPTPVVSYSRPDQPQPVYAQDYANPGAQDYADNSYQTLAGIPYIEHRRGERTHRPYQRGHGPSPRRN